MCVVIEKPKECFFCFDNSQYEEEVKLMRERMSKLLKKVDKNDSRLCYNKFKESLNNIDHENLKK